MIKQYTVAAAALFTVAGTAFGQCESSKAAQCESTETANVMAASFVQSGPDIVETAASAGMFNTLLAAAKAAGLAEALSGEGPFTVFAPTDEAFAALPSGTVETLLKPENKAMLASILKYHVVSGELDARDVTRLSGFETLNGQRVTFGMTEQGDVKVSGAKVVKADLQCSNGIIHVIDTVMLPQKKNIVQVAAGAQDFTTLIAAAKAAGLAEALMGDGPFTVFAPTDEAFAALPKGTVEMLLKPENKTKLASILKYHVVPGRVYAMDAAGAGRAETLLGQSVVLDFSGGNFRVDGAKIIATDIDASNGVIHVIDSVILPE